MHGTPPAPASSRSRSRSKPTGGQKHSQTRPRSWASTSNWHSGALDTGRGNWRRHRLGRRGLANQQSSPCRRAVHGRWLAQRPSRALSAPHLQAHPCGRGDHLMHQHVASGFHPSIRSKSHSPVLEESHYFTFLGSQMLHTSSPSMQQLPPSRGGAAPSTNPQSHPLPYDADRRRLCHLLHPLFLFHVEADAQNGGQPSRAVTLLPNATYCLTSSWMLENGTLLGECPPFCGQCLLIL
jgi:hypothetical protein